MCFSPKFVFVHGSVQKVGTKEGGSLACKISLRIHTLCYLKHLLIYDKECGSLNLPVPEDSRAAFFFLFLNLTLICIYSVLED